MGQQVVMSGTMMCSFGAAPSTLVVTPENKVMAQTIRVMKISTVADSIVKGIEKGTYLIIPGLMARIIDRFSRWFPALSRMVADMRLKKAYRGADHTST